MNKTMNKTLSQREEEIKLLIRYAVPEAQQQEAAALVEKHGGDPVALNIFHHFYSFLPDAREDCIRLLRLLARKEGAFLICATTLHDDYLYLSTNEGAEFLGTLGDGIWDQEILRYFRYKDRQAFLAGHRDLSRFPVYIPAHLDETLCPACHAAAGEYHTLGCPVEVCPWCGGQLTSCNCRFSHLHRDTLGAANLSDLQALLDQKGRIPFEPAHHRPGYPSAGGTVPGTETG